MPAARSSFDGAGILTDGIVMAGGGPNAEAFEYDGTNWTEGGDLNAARFEIAGFGHTTSTAVATGGNDPAPLGLLVESYNGTAWVEDTDLLTSRGGHMAFGADGAGVTAGGEPTLATTEEWTLTGASVETVAFD